MVFGVFTADLPSTNHWPHHHKWMEVLMTDSRKSRIGLFWFPEE
jgi:hypothetical protein